MWPSVIEKQMKARKRTTGLKRDGGEKEKEFNLSQGKTGGWERPEREDYIETEREKVSLRLRLQIIRGPRTICSLSSEGTRVTTTSTKERP